MAKTPTQIRIDADIKQQATDLFNNLGLDMSGAVNLFSPSVRLERRASFYCRDAFLQPTHT